VAAVVGWRRLHGGGDSGGIGAVQHRWFTA
jgi:hypothetical protein